MGGDAETAKPYLTQFTAYIEKAMAWPSGTIKGSFLIIKSGTMEYFQREKPVLAVLEPPLYFELRQKFNLKPIVEFDSPDLVSSRLLVVVKNPALTSLEQLNGKKIWTPLADFPQYLSRVVLGSKTDAAKHFKLKRVGQVLKGVRAVLRGEADATVLDDEQFALAKKMEGGADLRAIFQSAALPPMVVAGVAHRLTSSEEKNIAQTLMNMCQQPKGKDICREMLIRQFKPVNQRILKSAQVKYDQL
jgi:hypothetical protein